MSAQSQPLGFKDWYLAKMLKRVRHGSSVRRLKEMEKLNYVTGMFFFASFAAVLRELG
jgi:hypothetical protein